MLLYSMNPTQTIHLPIFLNYTIKKHTLIDAKLDNQTTSKKTSLSKFDNTENKNQCKQKMRECKYRNSLIMTWCRKHKLLACPMQPKLIIQSI